MLLKKEKVGLKKDYSLNENCLGDIKKELPLLYEKMGLFTCDLYAEVEGLNNDYILIYGSEFSLKPIFAVTIFENGVLVNEDAVGIYNDFIENINEQYDVKNLIIISKHGYSEDVLYLEKMNVRFDDYSYIEELMLKSSNNEPMIELFAHNKEAYNELVNTLKTSDRAAVVQATGTGKSFIIFKLLLDYDEKQKIVVAPSNFIIDELKENYPGNLDNVHFFTYQKFYTLKEEEMFDISPSLIVYDEMHRLGAKEWSRGYDIAESYKAKYKRNFKSVGFSATPIRYLDNNRNIAEEFFDGKCVSELSLTDAISRNILPMPNYISSFYSLDSTTDEYLENINKSHCDTDVKLSLKKSLNKAKVQWENTCSVDKILSKHIDMDGKNKKFIVFCESISHIESIKSSVVSWFKKAFPYIKINDYKVNSFYKNSTEDFINFKNNNSNNAIDLLFSVNMLNEGVHLKNVFGESIVSGVIFLRNTRSMSVFFQQLGRALEVNGKKNPLIFDFVNNLNNIGGFEFKKELENSMKKEFLNRQKYGIRYINEDYILNIHDYTLPTRELLEIIDEKVWTVWDKNIEKLKVFKETHGHCKVTKKNTDDTRLLYWVKYQRCQYNEGLLPKAKVDELNSIGFVWDILQYEWDERFLELKKFKEKNGHCNVNQLGDDRPLAMWVAEQRKKYKRKELSEDKIERLEKIGMIWDVPDALWNKTYLELKKYKEKNGTALVKKGEADNFLYKWTITQRRRLKTGKLDEEKIALLNEIGFEWDAVLANWMEKYNRLIEYKKIYGDCNVSKSSKDFEDIAIWVYVQRVRHYKGELDDNKIKLLEDIGFLWNTRFVEGHRSWDDFYNFMVHFKKEFGHCNLLERYTKGSSAYVWLKEQLNLLAEGKLEDERFNKIKELECEQLFLDPIWCENFNKVKDLIENQGINGLVSEIENEDIVKWIRNQRQIYSKGNMSARKGYLLNKIGFIWDEREFAWNYKYNQLKEYKKRFGNCSVPKNWSENKALSFWVRNQRNFILRGTISEDRKAKLDLIGF